ncbi:hypothetical protein CVT24_008264 [Panaeolus cyanescens]|uniref:Carbonic anhydrase n=1 Tax=Panaeolus cyanescens TaxID=181874 RepID=A0A409W0F8_9AGAR|nr:hypothetical protein CVT24_008264 [Panaeolus cyanescens]
MDINNPAKRLLRSNEEWAKEVQFLEPNFFKESAKGQTPHTLWIGCSDSRVPESVITAARPGDIFVQRNIANQFHVDDVNALAVLKYAVEDLKVDNIVVVGHTECGGAKACLAAASVAGFNPTRPIATIPNQPVESALNVWLAPLTRLAAFFKLTTANPKALNTLIDENVKAQVDALARTATVLNVWGDARRDFWIHGWVYDLSTGRLRDLNVSKGPPHGGRAPNHVGGDGGVHRQYLYQVFGALRG